MALVEAVNATLAGIGRVLRGTETLTSTVQVAVIVCGGPAT